MNKQRKISLFWLTLLTALAVPFLAEMGNSRRYSLAQEPEIPVPTFTPPASIADNTLIRIDGSPSMTVINQSLEKGFENRYPGADVQLGSSGTDTALQELLAGDLDMAAVGRPLIDEERAQGLTEVPISREKIAVIVGTSNPFRGDLTFEEFAQIFRGEITNWSQLGGPNVPIRFIDRPPFSDTRQALSGYSIFKNAPFQTGSNAVAVAVDDTAEVVRMLENDGISYAIASQVLNQDNVWVISMHSTLPDNALYPYSQPRGYVYRGEPSLAVEAFLGFATNPEGQQAIAEAKADEAATVATADILPGVVAVSPDGQILVLGKADGTLEWYDAQGQPLGIQVPAHQGLVTGVTFAPDGQSILSSGADGTLRRWDPQGNPLEPVIQGSDGPMTALAIRPDGQQIVNGNHDGTLERWNPDGTSLGSPVAVHSDSVRALVFTPDGQTLISGSKDESIRFRGPTGNLIKAIENAHAGGVTALAVSPDQQPDQQFVVSGGADGTLQFWDAMGNPRGNAINAHSQAVTAISISPDGQTVATAGEDNTLRLWDPQGIPKGMDPGSLPSPIRGLQFTADGNLVAGFTDGNLEVRDGRGQLTSGDLPSLPNADPSFNFLQALQKLPRSTWWIVALVPALLILGGLIWALLGGKSQFDETLDETLSDEDELEGTSLEGAAGGGLEGYPGSPGMGGDRPPAWIGLDPNTNDLSLGDKLGQARADLAEGTRLAREGRYEESLGLFNNAIEAAEVERMKALAAGASLAGIVTVLSQALSRRGEVLSLLGRSDTALTSFNRALETESNLVEAWVGKGRLLASMGRFDEALFCFDKALELDPNSGPAWAGKGRALIQMGRQQEGQMCLSRAATLGGDEDFIPAGVSTEVGVGVLEPGDMAGFTPEPLPAPITPGPIGPIGPISIDEPDIPPELQHVIGTLPSETSPEYSPAAIASDPEIPPELRAVIANLPDEPEAVETLYSPVHAGSFDDPDEIAPPLAEGPPPGFPTTETFAIAPEPPFPEEMPPPMPGPIEPDETTLLEPPPTQEMSGQSGLQPLMAGDMFPAESMPIESMPIESMPIESMPIERMPVEGMSGYVMDTGEDLTGPEYAGPEYPGIEPAGPEYAGPEYPEAAPMDSGEALPIERFTPDNPDAANALADLPPEVLAALQGIPADSPDYLGLPSIPAPPPPRPTPPPVPANPRLMQPPPPKGRSWATLSFQEPDGRLYVIWELDSEQRTMAKRQGGQSLMIRLFDVTDQEADSTPSNPMDEQDCYELARDWYLALPKRGRTYQTEIGYRSDAGEWFGIVFSNSLAVS